MQLIILSALVAVAAASYGSSGSVDHYSEPNYSYGYSVSDPYSGVDNTAQENRLGHRTEGSYSTLLPDGRKQIVEYWVDGDSGYNAKVSYVGVAHHPKTAVKSSGYGHGAIGGSIGAVGAAGGAIGGVKGRGVTYAGTYGNTGYGYQGSYYDNRGYGYQGPYSGNHGYGYQGPYSGNQGYYGYQGPYYGDQGYGNQGQFFGNQGYGYQSQGYGYDLY